MQAAWPLTLARYTGRRRVVFGNTVAGRPGELPDSDRIVGLFINTLPVAVEIPESGLAWLQDLQQAGAAARDHGHLALFEIQRLAGHAGTGLFDTLMVFENYPADDVFADGLPEIHEFTHYPLTLAVLPGDPLRVVFAYDSAVLPPQSVAVLIEGFEQALRDLARNDGASGTVTLDEHDETVPQVPRPVATYEAPRGDAEAMLAALWQEVLEVERVGRQDHFFDLGGHSLLALRIVGLARRRYNAELPLQALFDSPRLADCAVHLRAAADAGALVPVPRNADLPASPAQRRLWFIQQLDPENGAYHIPLGLDVDGMLDVDALQRALNVLVARHEILRTRFVAIEGEPHQRVLAEAPITVATADVRGEAGAEAAARTWLRDWLERPFDLAREPLLRMGVVRTGEHNYRLLLVQHHIITDGWSTNLFLRELIETYKAVLDDASPHAPSPAVQFADYAAWFQKWLASPEAGRQKAYWQDILADRMEPPELPTDVPHEVAGRAEGARHAFRLAPEVAERLSALARKSESTVFAPLLTAWMLLLHRHGAGEAINVGVPVSGRTRPETQSMLGCFVNLVTISVEIAPWETFTDLLSRVAARTAAAQSHQDIPFEQVVTALDAGREPTRHPLFQVVFNHQQESLAALADWPGAEVNHFDPGAAGAQFDLALDTEVDAAGGLSGFISYNRALFDDATIERLCLYYQQLIEVAVATPDRPLATLVAEPTVAATGEVGRNGTAVDWGPFDPLPLRQSRQAARTPDAVALCGNGHRLTYGELERQVNRLAHRLREAGVGPEVRVGVHLERSVELVIAILAIARAGGAYVPLDPAQPRSRLRTILAEAAPRLVFSDTDLDDVPCWKVCDALSTAYPDTPPPVSWHPDQALYVIYTSGSTGQPKGVVNTHGALENRLLWQQAAYPLDESDCVLQKTPFGFDVSVWEFFWPFITGARLAVAPPEAHRDPSALRRIIDQERVTTVHFVPSMLQVTLPALTGCECLRRIICSGEALSTDLQRETLRGLPRVALHNLYGPTEAAIDVSHWTCRDDGRTSVPIGRAIANLRLYVLDGSLNPAPPGVPGELYLAGIGLARGYLERSGLTAERFLPDPHGPPGARMYRTGDRVRREPDGALAYLGRLDQQLKVRGVRIEPAEIESHLRQRSEIADAAVALCEDILVAYVVPAGELSGDWAATLKAALAEVLPPAFVPSRFVALDALPLSANGKLDRKALPRPESTKPAHRPPETPLQRRIASIWREVLACESVGLEDNFFDLGGHSLAAARAVALIGDRLGREVSLRRFFEAADLEALAANFEEGAAPTGELDEMAALLDELEYQ
jgi:amino acid adenylation domain-containing protein